jgi:tripartite-type tricarboxylate transporter receptor subunit TctC
MSKALRVTVIIENKPGRGDHHRHLLAWPPDGYTLLMGTFANAGQSVEPAAKLPYARPYNDFQAVVLVARLGCRQSGLR